MRAISQRRLGGPEVLELVSVPPPKPGPGEALIRVGAAGVNPADAKIRAGLVRRFGDPPFTLGLDVSGVVDALGPDVTGFHPGDAVYGCARIPHGAYAEYTIAPVSALAGRPAPLDDVQAAALPVAALTAWQSLARVADVRAGQRVLIHAASGGVGHLAVQIAKARGAHVLGTARASKHPFLRELGVDEPIDYTTTDFVTAAREIDVVIDPISDDYGLRSLETLAPDGILVDVRGTGPDRTAIRSLAAAKGRRYAEFGFTPSGADLAEIAALVESGQLRATVDTVLPLADAAKAHQLSESNSVAGKIVLTP